MEAARRALPDPTHFLEIKYETFCEQPLETCRRVLDFAELPRSLKFEQQVTTTPIKNTSHRWRDGLTIAQQRLLDDILREDLVRYEYDVSHRGEAIPETMGR
jgi:hypothetical protein